MIPRALHGFAVFTAVATFALLSAGGLVTSHGAGMAVPDWPNTFGYNMFFFPFSQWVGGVFYEHSHRLIASGVGLCTTILALWLHGRAARPLLRWSGLAFLVLGISATFLVPGHWRDAVVADLTGLTALTASFVWPRCKPAQPWLRRLGLAAFGAVVLQGILGGLRVVLFKDQIGIFHATLAQLFFALMCALALFTSRWWEESFGSQGGKAQNPLGTHLGHRVYPDLLGRRAPGVQAFGRLAWLSLAATGLILAQLILGATMRHQHAGLAIPDFPLAYGKVWPAMDPQSVTHYNQQRTEVVAENAITASQITLQMVHRLMALLILAAIVTYAWLARREFGLKDLVGRLSLIWFGLLLTQILLGAGTIWSSKAADIATAHVLVGALLLATGTILSIILLEHAVFARRPSLITTRPSAEPAGSFGAQPSPVLGIE